MALSSTVLNCPLKRCNLVTDCPDLSDEKDCDILSIGDDYRNELFPRAVDNSALSGHFQHSSNNH